MSEHKKNVIVTKRENRLNSHRVQTINAEPSKTQQQFKNDVNVNNIMKKYHATRTITHLNNRQGVYADISNAQDYFDSLTTIRQANNAFDQLPSHLRKRFNNDPAALLEFIHNPDNYDEGVKLGIFDPKQPTPNSPIAPTNKLPNDEPLNDESPTPSPKKPK